MIVHRILDAVFRTLDTVDAVRARLDAVLGQREAQPPSAWSPVIDNDRPADAVRQTYTEAPSLETWEAEAEGPAPSKPAAKKAPAPRAPAEKAEKAKASPAKKKAKASPAAAKPKKASTKKAPSTVPTAASRKGSVDRSGKDFDSPRARSVEAWIGANGAAVIAEDADLDGKRTLARVLWAVAVAEQAGTDGGLTAADTSALLSTAAGVEVFATNVARAFRDEPTLFRETTPDGRSKRYTVTDAGRARASDIATR